MFNTNVATHTNTRTVLTADVAAAAANNELEDPRPPHTLRLSHSATADGSSCLRISHIQGQGALGQTLHLKKPLYPFVDVQMFSARFYKAS